MSVVRSRDFLSFVRTEELVCELSDHHPESDGALIAVLRTKGSVAVPRFSATLSLLIATGLCTRPPSGGISPSPSILGKCGEELRKLLANALLVVLQAEQLLPDFCLGLTRKDGTFRLNVMTIPQSLTGATSLLFEYGILTRHDEMSYVAIIAPAYERHFLRGALLGNSNLLAKGFTPAQLNQARAAREEQGKEGEAWVLAFERRRLASHPLVDHVICISERAVDAGFDIVSFSDVDALTYDRYIEVKSYRTRPHFFWSAGEIDVARTMENQYHLVLVDLQQCALKDYSPITISDPYGYFFLSEQSRWTKRPNDYYFEACDA
jgi:hypothetical protein